MVVKKPSGWKPGATQTKPTFVGYKSLKPGSAGFVRIAAPFSYQKALRLEAWGYTNEAHLRGL